MKRTVAFILFFCVILCLSGCLPIAFYTGGESAYEEMEVYKVFSDGISNESTLEEFMYAFSSMCAVQTNSYSDIYLFEVHPYESDGSQYLSFGVYRQFLPVGHIDYIEIGFTVYYTLDGDIADFNELKQIENNPSAFIEYIQNSNIYQTLLTKEIIERNYGIGSW